MHVSRTRKQRALVRTRTELSRISIGRPEVTSLHLLDSMSKGSSDIQNNDPQPGTVMKHMALGGGVLRSHCNECGQVTCLLPLPYPRLTMHPTKSCLKEVSVRELDTSLTGHQHRAPHFPLLLSDEVVLDFVKTNNSLVKCS